MEQTPWRAIIVAAAASLILLFGVYYWVLPKEGSLEKPEAIEKTAEFRNTYIAGHQEGKKSWKFFAKYGWTGQNRDLTTLEMVEHGQIYDKQEALIVDQLTAPRVVAYRASKNIEASGSSTEALSARIAIAQKRPGQKRKFAFVITDQLYYYDSDKRTELHGDILVREKGLTLKASQITIDHQQETATLQGNISAIRNDLTLKCDKLVYYASNEASAAQNGVQINLKGKSPSKVKADSVHLYNDDKKDVQINGNIRLAQNRKQATADQAIYNKVHKTIDLSGKVSTILEKGKAILKEKTAKKLKNKEAKSLLETKTLLSSDHQTISTDTGDARAYGSVLVTQKNHQAKSDKAVYRDKDETVALTGNVYMKKDNKWVKCQQVTVSVRDETFEAVGKVEAEFKLKK